MAAGFQETGGQSAVDSGEENCWNPKVIDSDLKMDFQEELSAKLILETDPGQNPQDSLNQIGPEVPFLINEDGKKKKKKRRRNLLALKRLERELIAQESLFLICGATEVESQIVILKKLCVLLRQRWLPLGGEMTYCSLPAD